MFFPLMFVFIFGLVMGSFLNCIVYRLEKGESLWGRSYCPHCKHTLAWYDLVPILSFILLKGQCRYCHKKISSQYPLVELLTAVIFVALPYQQLIPLTNFLDVFFLFYVISSCIVILIYDLKHYLIPDKVLFPAIAVAVVYQALRHPASLGNYILAALLAAGFFFIIFLISRGRWIGFGDVKLAILMGFTLGTAATILALFLAFLFGAIIGVLLMISQRKGLKSEVPFAPFLIAGTFCTLLFGPSIIAWYLAFIIIA